jgi:hypothetical protein
VVATAERAMVGRGISILPILKVYVVEKATTLLALLAATEAGALVLLHVLGTAMDGVLGDLLDRFTLSGLVLAVVGFRRMLDLIHVR